jgi:hypothetical protein
MRIEPLPQSWISTPRLIGRRCRRAVPRLVLRSAAGTSPAVDSTQRGMRRHSAVPPTASAAVKNSAPGDPHSVATPAAVAPNTPPATSPNVVSRAFVVTSVMVGGNTRGVTAALSTTNDLDSTSIPRAAG